MYRSVQTSCHYLIAIAYADGNKGGSVGLACCSDILVGLAPEDRLNLFLTGCRCWHFGTPPPNPSLEAWTGVSNAILSRRTGLDECDVAVSQVFLHPYQSDRLGRWVSPNPLVQTPFLVSLFHCHSSDLPHVLPTP